MTTGCLLCSQTLPYVDPTAHQSEYLWYLVFVLLKFLTHLLIPWHYKGLFLSIWKWFLVTEMRFSCIDIYLIWIRYCCNIYCSTCDKTIILRVRVTTFQIQSRVIRIYWVPHAFAASCQSWNPLYPQCSNVHTFRFSKNRRKDKISHKCYSSLIPVLFGPITVKYSHTNSEETFQGSFIWTWL